MKAIKNSSESLKEAFEHGHVLGQQGYRGRFAPSPSGPLHLGNLRTALISWLRARIKEGFWLLRIDDLDTPRNRQGSIESIQDDLLWLGLSWDGPIIYQSDREKIYHKVLNSLRENRRLFACECSRKMLRMGDKPPKQKVIYPGTCRKLILPLDNDPDKCRSWRLKVNKRFSKTSGDIIL